MPTPLRARRGGARPQGEMAAISARERVRRWVWGTERIREALVGYAFILVPMGFFLLFFIFPIGYAVYISRYDWGIFGKIDYLGWGNYSTLFHDEIFWRAVKNTAMFTVAVVILEVGLGLALAVVVNQTLRFRTFYRAGFYFPSIASSAAITAIAIYVLSADGLFDSFLGLFGYHTNRPWFYDSSTALWSIVGLNGWTTSGTIMLFYLAALQSIPVDVYEAAAIDGARAWRTFWKVTFPLLRPAHFFVLVVAVIGALQIFDQAFLVAGPEGGPNYSTMTVVLYLYAKAIANAEFGYAAAVGVVLFVGIFTITVLQRLLFGRPEVA
jgi:multiple sugar transport system permease protein